MNAIFTIAAKNYLASALTLRNSIKESGTQCSFIIVLADEKTDELLELDEKIIGVSELNILNYERMAFKYDIVEFSTSIKPFAFDYLFNCGYDKVIYLDPDVYVYGNLNELFDRLDTYSMLLTPHVVDPKNGMKKVHIYDDFLACGIYNLGFVGISKSEEGKSIIKWWCNKLENYCINYKMYFVDQKWMDFAPALFGNIYIIRNKQYNIAWWNFSERMLEKIDDIIYINDEQQLTPVSFIHFSNFKPGYPLDYYKYRGVEVEEKQKKVLSEIYKEYEIKLEKNNYHKYSAMKYKYGSFDDGQEICYSNRKIYNILIEEGYEIEDPFSPNGDLYKRLKKKHLLKKNSKNSKSTKKEFIFDKRHHKIDWVIVSLLKIIYRVIGIENYEKLIRYIKKYYSIEQQDFLIR